MQVADCVNGRIPVLFGVAHVPFKGPSGLSQRLRQPDGDPLRKIRFREAARDIVAKDRYDRKYGRAVDTAGAIARAMERAYRQGFGDAQSERPAPPSKPLAVEAALEWVLIPPRPRSAFWTVCRFALGRQGEPECGGHLVLMITERGTQGWQLFLSNGDSRDAFGERTIAPLARLGLLEPAREGLERLLISDRGKATWQIFLERGGHYPDDLTQV